MKSKFGWFAGLISMGGMILALGWLTGCGGGDGGGVGGNNVSGTNAPTGFGNRTLTHAITAGTAPMNGKGAFVVRTDGAPEDTTGNYTLTGSGGVTNSTGTFTYTQTSPNTASLILQDTVFGEVDETLTFQTQGAGTYSSSLPTGGTQAGAFTLQ